MGGGENTFPHINIFLYDLFSSVILRISQGKYSGALQSETDALLQCVQVAQDQTTHSVKSLPVHPAHWPISLSDRVGLQRVISDPTILCAFLYAG